jgi:dynein heavy chain
MQLSQTLDEWMTCQRNWMYLESIFGQGDIQKQLPDEAAKFLKVDQFWKETMRATHKAPNVVEAATTDEGLLKKFADANALLEQVLIAAAATTGIPRDTVPLCRSKSRSRTTC